MRITVTDTATPMLLRLQAGVSVAQSGPVAGRAVSNLVRSHLFARNASHPNQIGGRRTNFWAQAARSTQMQPTATGAEVGINLLGFRLQYAGGTVRPVRRRYLTIPAVPEAHGKLASEWPDLEFAFVKDSSSGRMRPALVQAKQTEIRITKGGRKGPKVSAVASTLGNQAIYWLTKKATIPAHPEALPTVAAMGASASAALSSYYRRIIARRSGNRT